MSQIVEVTEERNNGRPISPFRTKSLVVQNIESINDEGGKAQIFMRGKGTKDERLVSESYNTVSDAANAAPTADVKRVVKVTVKAKQGDLEERTTPYSKAIPKNQIVEFYADDQEPNDSQIVVVEGVNPGSAERSVYLVDDTYTALKAEFDA